MIQIILLIAGIVYAFRKPKLKALTAAQFPGVSQEVFAEWQALELKSINRFLWATWGLLLIKILVGFMPTPTFPGGEVGVQVFFFGLFVGLLVFSAISGSKAAKLKEQNGIKWP